MGNMTNCKKKKDCKNSSSLKIEKPSYDNPNEIIEKHCYCIRIGEQKVKKTIVYNHIITANITHNVKEVRNCIHSEPYEKIIDCNTTQYKECNPNCKYKNRKPIPSDIIYTDTN